MTITPEQITEIADQFDCLLRQQIGEENYQTVIDRNDAEPDKSVCHSHDFCDANQTMIDAFENVIGRAPECGTSPECEDDMAAMGGGWNEWRSTGRVKRLTDSYGGRA